MDEEIVDIIAGQARIRALSHVVSVLAYENFLSECVRKQVDFRQGNFLSVDPARRRFDQIENFAWGSGAGHDSDIGKRLLNSLTSSPNRFMVVDDVMGDIASKGKFSAVANNQIYHWIIGMNATEKDLNNLVWATGVSWHFLGVIFSGGIIPNVSQCIVDGKYADLGVVVEVVVGAYDGEGFIHWLPN